jgi:hypothetical protein
MRLALFTLLLPLCACSDNGLVDPSERDPTASEDLDPIGVGECGFEDGDLSGFGHPGEVEAFPPEGGKVLIVEEGMDFSWLSGEEILDFPVGSRALLLRSNDAGDLDATAVITTNPFVPQHPVFVMDQLSEVDGTGLVLEVEIIDEGFVVDRWELPIETGGYVPELLPEHDPIEGFDNINHHSHLDGDFVRTLLDVSEWHEDGEEIQIRFRQRTLVPFNGFFTLLDNLCDGEPTPQ